MTDNLISARLRNRKLERALHSPKARKTARRLRRALACRGVSCADREALLYDTLLAMGESESRGLDAVAALLGLQTVEQCADGMAAACGTLPRWAVSARLLALLALSWTIFALMQLVYRCAASLASGSWLEFPLVGLRTSDVFSVSRAVVPLALLLALGLTIARRVRGLPGPHALPAVAAPIVLQLVTAFGAPVGPLDRVRLYLGSLFGDPGAGYTILLSDHPYDVVNAAVIAAVLLVLLLAALSIWHAVERRHAA